MLLEPVNEEHCVPVDQAHRDDLAEFLRFNRRRLFAAPRDRGLTDRAEFPVGNTPPASTAVRSFARSLLMNFSPPPSSLKTVLPIPSKSQSGCRTFAPVSPPKIS